MRRYISAILVITVAMLTLLSVVDVKANGENGYLNNEKSGLTGIIQQNTGKVDSAGNDLLSKLTNAQDNYGCINILGDSISQGYSVSYEDQYATLLFNKVFDLLEVKDSETDINIPNLGNEYFKYEGKYSFGKGGPIRQSLILQPDAAITFTGDYKYVDVWYQRTPSSGSIQVLKDGRLIKTIDLSGEKGVATSYPTASVEQGRGVYTIKCVDAPVEILGVIRLNSEPGSAMYCNRIALSGTATSDYIYPDILESIYRIGSLNNSKKNLFIIALGTNDIYNKDKTVNAAMYKENMMTIAKYLRDRGQDVVLYFPPTANESIYSSRMGIYSMYKEALFSLADELKVPVIDVSSVNINAPENYMDGLHPNANGHKLYYKQFLEKLLNIVPQLKYAKIRRMII